MFTFRSTKIRKIVQFCRYSSVQQSHNYCIELVKKYDYDHYLCTLLLPKTVQSAVFALRAFNVEIAQIKDSISESHIGKLRIQFWRDRISSIYQNEFTPSHPVVLQLSEAVHTHNLNKIWLTRLLDAREKDLGSSVFYTTNEIESYAENTYSSLLYLTLQSLGIQDVNVDHAASHIGKAEGIVTILRASAYYRTKRSLLIPMDILSRHGANQEDFLRGNITQAVEDSIYDFATLAHAHLKKAYSLKEHITSTGALVFLPAVLCQSFLDTLQKVGFDPFSPKLSVRNSLLPVKLLWKSIRKRYC